MGDLAFERRYNTDGTFRQHVVQTVCVQKTDIWAASSPNGYTFQQVDGLQPSIVLSDIRNKVLVMGSLSIATGYWSISGALFRNNVIIPDAIGDARGSNRVSCLFDDNYYENGTYGYNRRMVPFTYLDTPGVKNVTYSIGLQGYSTYNVALNYLVFRDNDGTDYDTRTTSEITLFEIASE